jgi:ABC-type branched-subunit amino acid transport system ATPase component/ABC-type branched-subunit amino acid transport system permease subunit
MHELVLFAVLGLGTGAIYAILAEGVVLIYRGSGVVNFAQGGFAMVGAFLVSDLRDNGWPILAAFAGSALVTALLAGLCYWVVMRPLRSSSLLVQLIGTLALLLTIQAAGALIWGSDERVPPNVIPASTLHWWDIEVSTDRLWLLLIAAVSTAAMWLVSRRTRFGLATKAVSENALGAQTLGWSPDRLSLINWSIAGSLAAVAGGLVAPITGLQVTNLSFIVYTGLAAALLAKFDSFPLAMAYAVGLGIAESVTGHYIETTGWSTAMPFLITVAILMIRSKSYRARGDIAQRLPAMGRGRVRPWTAVVAIVAAVAITWNLSAVWDGAVIVTGASAVTLLSVVVLTGYTGQISLAQSALGGVGALAAGRLVAAEHWPLALAMVAGILAAIVAGVALGIPALRTRGISFALVTLGLGLAFQEVIFNNYNYTGGTSGTTVGPQTFLGIDIDGVLHPQRYAVFVLIILFLIMLMLGKLRRSRAGRRLIAVRSNERAAASIGIDITGAKFFAFSLSSAIAGLGGILIAFQSYTVVYTNYTPLESITFVAYAVIGGVGFVSGGFLGATMIAGAVGAMLIQNVLSGSGKYITLIGGVLTLVLLLQNQNGLAATWSNCLQSLSAGVSARFGERRSWWIRAILSTSEEGTGPSPMVSAPGSLPLVLPGGRVPEATLRIVNLGVRYGGLIALDNVNLSVGPGEIVGIIGPNGAGKTTLLDAVTGFTKSTGAVSLSEMRIERLSPHRRARLGVSRSFQSLELFEELTVRENLGCASDDQRASAYIGGLVRAGRSDISAAAAAAARDFGLEEDLDRVPGALPQGRRRLVAIARAVAAQPSILLLDEPAAGLDENESAELGPLLRSLALEWGIGILLVEHDMSLVMGLCDRVVVLNFGQVIATGSPSEVRADPIVINAYLGDDRAINPGGPEGEALCSIDPASTGPIS